MKLNEGVIDILRRTHIYQTTGTIALTGGTADYQLAATILTLLKVYTTASGATFRLTRVGVDELIDLRTSSAYQSSPVSRYALAGATTFMIYPTPSGNDTVNTLYVPVPTAMSAAGNDPSATTFGGIPAQWHYGIELYALWKMADSIDDSSSGQGERYRLLYEGENGKGGYLAQMRAEERRRGGRGQRAQRPGSSRRAVAHANDTYGRWS